MPTRSESSHPGPGRGATQQAPPPESPLARPWGRLLLSRRAAAAGLLVSLALLLGVPLAFGTTGGTPDPARVAPSSTTGLGDLASTLYPSGPPSVDCDDYEQRLNNPMACLEPSSTPRSGATSSSPETGSSKPTTRSPTTTSKPSRTSTSSEPCEGEDCLPHPTSTPPDPGGKQNPGGDGEDDDECGITDPIACVVEGINAVFRGIVESALNPLLQFLGDTLLSTPTLDQLPQVGPLWDNSWQILLASYTTLVLVGGVIVMGHQTLQTSYTAKDIAPRLVVGFLAGFLSLFVADKLIRLANGLSAALLGGGLNADSAGTALRDMVTGAISGGGLFLLLLGLALAVMLVALLITYIIRVAFTVMLLIGAPLALMFHALPQTEGIAKWWWKALTGVLAIQVAQSLALIVALKVFFEPSGWTPFGPKPSGLINLLVALALIFVLLKIPFWIMSATKVGGGRRSFIGGLVKGALAYKTLGLLKGTTAGATATRAAPAAARAAGSGARRPGGGGGGRGSAGGPPRVPPPRPRPPKPDGPRTPAASMPAPPIEDTPWGKGRTAHSTESAHHTTGTTVGQDGPEPTTRTVRGSSRGTADTPARAQRARTAAARAWRPLAGSSPTGTSARPASGAVVAAPIECTPWDSPGRAYDTRAPKPADSGTAAGSSGSSGRAARAAERVASREQRPIVSRHRLGHIPPTPTRKPPPVVFRSPPASEVAGPPHRTPRSNPPRRNRGGGRK